MQVADATELGAAELAEKSVLEGSNGRRPVININVDASTGQQHDAKTLVSPCQLARAKPHVPTPFAT